ncbi:11151_t:CDS:2 [Acaulospora morrowiae]|uniref:11151_t:CDS:1 n=1 Tax=Acaulospora morrowiae TaxID=94023 RepID=A0A9N8Z716_9GLOM|nr:11151_t:CDS:2 [Acaulospora morrowiae]
MRVLLLNRVHQAEQALQDCHNHGAMLEYWRSHDEDIDIFISRLSAYLAGIDVNPVGGREIERLVFFGGVYLDQH